MTLGRDRNNSTPTTSRRNRQVCTAAPGTFSPEMSRLGRHSRRVALLLPGPGRLWPLRSKSVLGPLFSAGQVLYGRRAARKDSETIPGYRQRADE
jgi:hypothetical protein